MANVAAVRSVSNSLIQFLSSSFPEDDLGLGSVAFRLLSSFDLSNPDFTLNSGLSLYLYRVSVNDHLRNTRPHPSDGRGTPLHLNLHYLLSAWSDTAESEQVLLAWGMRHLHEHPILDASLLTPDGNWARDEVIHVAPEELSNEDLLRLWETLAPTYRLSYSYVARVVIVESTSLLTGSRVIATRFQYGQGGPL
jgi:hypothetical protein